MQYLFYIYILAGEIRAERKGKLSCDPRNCSQSFYFSPPKNIL